MVRDLLDGNMIRKHLYSAQVPGLSKYFTRVNASL